MRLFEKIFICVVAVTASVCAGDVYNPGDPASDEWLVTNILECLIHPNCPDSLAGAGVGTGTATLPVLAAGSQRRHNAVLFSDGRIRVWGRNQDGPLGINSTTDVGDGTGPSISDADEPAVGGTVSLLAAGSTHTCGLLSGGTVRCWGQGNSGRLGYNNTANVGNGIGLTIIARGDVPVGGTVVKLAAGNDTTCVILDTGGVRCWGAGTDGRLGYGNTNNVGNGGGPTITAAGDVPVGGTVTDIALGGSHACAILSAGNVRCWGRGADGQLGHGNTNNVGDGVGLSITAAGDVPVGGTVTQITAGTAHTCALLSSGNVRCWGSGVSGRLGYNSGAKVGDGVGLSIIAAGDVPVGGTVTKIAAGSNYTCALLVGGTVRCWGPGTNGRLGHNATANIGTAGLPIITAGDVPLGGTAVDVVPGLDLTCAMLDDASVRCWGSGARGRLGYNSTANIGDGVGLSIIAAGNVPYQ